MHSFATQAQREAYLNWKDAYIQSICTKSVTDEEAAKKILKGFLKGMQNEDDKEYLEVVKDLQEILNTTNDMRNNRMSDPMRKALGEPSYNQKGVTSSVMPMMPRTVVEFRNMFNEDDIDDFWMMVYQTDVVTDSMAMSLADVKNLVSFKRLKSSTDKLPFGDFMKSTWDNMEAIYFGGGVAASEEILKKDPLTTVNNIIIAIRIAAEVQKTTEATTAFQAGIVAANSGGYTTAFTSSIIKTLNKGRRDLIQRVKGQGFNLNGNTQTVLIANESLRGDIEAQFLQTNSVPFGTVQVSYPITRVYTENVADDLGLGGAVKAVMVLPFRKNRFGLFKSLEIKSWEDPETASRKIGGREAYNFLTNEAQFQILTLA